LESFIQSSSPSFISIKEFPFHFGGRNNVFRLAKHRIPMNKTELPLRYGPGVLFSWMYSSKNLIVSAPAPLEPLSTFS
jgi:hypothetical protein